MIKASKVPKVVENTRGRSLTDGLERIKLQGNLEENLVLEESLFEVIQIVLDYVLVLKIFELLVGVLGIAFLEEIVSSILLFLFFLKL